MMFPLQIRMIRAWIAGEHLYLPVAAGKTYARNVLRRIGRTAIN